MRQRYDGYKSTFGQVPEPQGNGKWGFICLTIVCILAATLCFGTVGRQVYAQNQAARIAAAQALRVSQAAAVQSIMTVFPAAPHKAVRSDMASYLASGFGDDGYNGTYTEIGTHDGYPAYKLDDTHQLFYQGNNSFWALAATQTFGAVGTHYIVASNQETPDLGVWSVLDGTAPAGTVTLATAPADTTAPVIDTATGVSIAKDGATYYLSVPFTDAGIVSGTTGWTLTGTAHGAATLGTPVITTNVAKFAISRLIYSDETSIKANYAPGNFTDDSANAMVAISDVAVTVTSSDVMPLLKPVVMKNGQLQNLQAGDDLAFTATTPLDWDTAAPTGISEAINRLAAELAVQKGSAIT